MLSPKEIEDIQAKAYICKPVKLDKVAFIYPRTMADIIEMGFNTYMEYLGLLLMDKQKIQEIIKEKTKEEIPLEQIEPLEYLLSCAQHSDNFLLELQNAFFTFLQEEVLLLPDYKAVVVGSPSDKRFITVNNFSKFQEILKIQNRRQVKTAPPQNETEGQKKMRLLRERVEEVKRKQAQKNGETETTIIDLLESASVFGIDIEKCSLFAFYGLIGRHQRHEKWLTDIQMICAGADPKEVKTKYWGESSKKE